MRLFNRYKKKPRGNSGEAGYYYIELMELVRFFHFFIQKIFFSYNIERNLSQPIYKVFCR